MNDRIWLKQPARIWEEAFPIGNGKTGGMVFGNTDVERISLNIDTLWSGHGKEKLRKNTASVLETIRKKILEDNPEEAEFIMKEQFLNDWNESFLPLGDIFVEYKNLEGNVKNYVRELRMNQGVSVTNFEKGERKIQTSTFCSVKKNLLVIELTCDKKIDFEIWFDSKLQHVVSNGINNAFGIQIYGEAPSRVFPNYYETEESIQYNSEHPGMEFYGILKICVDTGSIIYKGKHCVVTGAKKVICFFCAGTTYEQNKGQIIGPIEKVIEKCTKSVKQMDFTNYEKLLRLHQKSFSEYYERMSISLSQKEIEIPTNERIERFQKDDSDTGIVEVLFNYGRYLLMSCSQPGSMAANLQGIWNDKLRAPWSSNYTTNINLQMNYWLAEKSNLSEFHEPLFELLSNCVDSGRKTAREQFGCRGWVANHNIDCWYQTSPVGALATRPSSKYGYFPMASGWLCLHIWEHYKYTNDKSFLAKYYIVLKEACNFYVDYLVQFESGYTTCPSTSPENLYYNKRKSECALSKGSTMDISIIRMLFSAMINVTEILNCDLELKKNLENILAKLPPYGLRENGALREWEEDYDEVYPTHRHVSHLIGLYPGNEFVNDQNLLEGCRKSLNYRDYDGTAWCKVWKACLFAKLKDGEMTYKQLKRFMVPMESTEIEYQESGLLSNCICTPPFQVDGNLGVSAAIMEMLVCDTVGTVELLPAIPNIWSSGAVKGMKIVGGHELSFKWINNKVCNISIFGAKNEQLTIKCDEKNETVMLKKCEFSNIIIE